MTGVLIVTGASRGIGAATARMAGARGYAVAVNYRDNAAKADAVATDIERAGGHAITVQADVATAAGVHHLFEETDRRLGTLTALFNNAGIIHRLMLMEESDEAVINRLFAINVTSQFLVAGEAVKRMSTRHGGKGGAIVNMSSAGARIGGAGGLIAYSATKGAIDTMTKGLAAEVGPDGIRVNAVRPGLIETEIHADTGDAERTTRLAPSVPLRRVATPEEVAECVLWLLSPAASYVTGDLMDVSGGR